MELSVILCTYNPRPDYLRRVLDALRTQTLPQDQWELLIIDNASNEPLVKFWDLSWHPHGRIIREEELGLTAARLRGMQEAIADLFVFSDDDTLFDRNYLAEALRICRKWPMLGAWGGQPVPEFESPPPDWTKPYQPMLALCRTERDCWSNNYDGFTLPIGAGMCIRSSVAKRFASYVTESSLRRRLCRKGNELSAGEDTDMALTACDMGLGTGRFMSLNFIHLIPSRRLSLDYLLAVHEGMVFSGVIQDSYRPKLFPQKPLLRLLAGYLWRIVRGDRYQRRFQLVGLRTEWKARRLLAKQSRTKAGR